LEAALLAADEAPEAELGRLLVTGAALEAVEPGAPVLVSIKAGGTVTLVHGRAGVVVGVWTMTVPSALPVAETVVTVVGPVRTWVPLYGCVTVV
jgi:hypothetical protein